MGATGWIGGFTGVLPEATVRCSSSAGRALEEALPLYRALLPLLRWDTGPQFVQAIKLAQTLVGQPGGATRPAAPAAARGGRQRWSRRSSSGARRARLTCAPRRVLHAVDSHTEGMPTRVITGGVGTLPGATMLERKLAFERERDDLRTLLMYEPRGHGAMSGAILQPPTRPDADVGVLFIEVSGCLAMCGHGTIGVARSSSRRAWSRSPSRSPRSASTPRPGWSPPRSRSATAAPSR
jgi:hypothetical protein